MRLWLYALLGLLSAACNRGSTGEVNITHTSGAALGEDAGMTVAPSAAHRTVPVGSTTGVGASRAPGAAGDAGSRFEK
jgi:hypothetical protein